MAINHSGRKRRFYSKPVMAVIFIAIYLAGLLLGFIVLCGVPFFRYRSDLKNLSRDRGEFTLSSFVEYTGHTYGTDYYLFNSDMLLIFGERSFSDESMLPVVREYAERTFQEGEIYSIFIDEISSADNTPRSFFLVAGATMTGPNGSPYASVTILDLPNLISSLYAFLVIFTIMYIIYIYLFIRYIKKQKKLNNMQRDFIANVSHELKTPITSIKSSAGIMYDGLGNSEELQHKYSQIILSESDHLENIVKDILELSKLQSDRADFTKSAVYCDEIFDPVIDRYMMLCFDTGRTLDVDSPDLESIPAIMTNPQQVTRLINVFMENAVKFSGEGGHVRLSIKDSSDCLTVCVQDDGPGIDSETQKHIFDRFYKGDPTHNTKGSGLGLSIASEIAKGLEEKIWVESRPGTGTSFYFTLHH